jgi:uncharacterized protein
MSIIFVAGHRADQPARRWRRTPENPTRGRRAVAYGVGVDPTTPTPAIAIADAPDRERYEIAVDGALAGFAQYRRRPGLLAFVHTEIDPAFAGRGLASQLIGFALDDARAHDLAILPFCPFVNGYLEKHAEYVPLVPEAFRAKFGL